VGAQDQTDRGSSLTLHLLDTTVLIDHLRGHDGVTDFLLGLLADGHDLGTSCVNIAEVIRGTRPKQRKSVEDLLARLTFLETTLEAATRAGRYQADFAVRGITIHTADALIAGTARAHGSILITDNVDDFPMRDVQVQAPPAG
jgi:predicted nucleic acid-binding protein